MNYDNLSKEELITELSRLKEAQQITENVELVTENLFGFFEMRSDIIFAFTRTGEVKFFNTACKRSLGYSSHELQNTSVFDLVEEDDKNLLRDYLSLVLNDQNDEKVDLRFFKKNGAVIHLNGTINCPARKNDEIIFIAVLADNTAKVKAESNQQLYYQVSQLSLESENLDELLQSIHELLKEHIFANNFLVALFEEKTQNIQFPYYFDELFGGKVDSYQRLYTKGLTEYTYNRAKPVLLKEKDISKLVEKGEVELLGQQPKIWLGVPLKIGKRITGVISVKSHSDENKYSKSDLGLLDFVSGQLALVIERKQYEDEVNENRAHLESIFNSSQHLIWTVNRLRGLTSFNKNYAESLYKKYGTYPVIDPSGGSERLMLSAKAYHGYVDEMYAKAFAGEYVHFETKMSPEEGDNVWRETFLAPIYRSNGRIEEVTGISHDVTEKKLQEIALQKSEEKFRDIFESFQDVYVRTDRTGVIVLVSPSVKELSGYMPDEIIGEKIGSYFFNDDEKTIKNIKQLIAEGEVANYETEIVTKDGLKIPSLINMKLIPHEEGKVQEIDYVIRNISVLKAASEELIKAKEIAEKSLEVKEIFLANMSHEIRTPMNGMIALIDLLNDTKLDDEQKEYVSTIKKSSGILLNILNDILDLSKLEAGKMELRLMPVSVQGVLDKLISLFLQKAVSKGITLKSSMDAGVPVNILGDETRLLQVLSNLTSNAIKFTDHGDVHIQVELEKTLGTDIYLKFVVADSGVGVSPEDQEKLFKNFNQVDSSITKSHSGTGLGLSISKALCEVMGGEIGVKSEIGEGSSFWFTIKTKASEEAPIRENQEAFMISKNHFGDQIPHILLVDDNSVNRRVAGTILKKAGCIVDFATNGQEAVQKVKRKNDYNAVLMDIQMPVMDGLTATKEIKKTGLMKIPPIVAMTAFSLEDDKEKLLNAGLDYYLAKPITAEKLILKLKEVLSGMSEGDSQKIVSHIPKESTGINMAVVDQLKGIGGQEMLEEVYVDFLEEAGNLLDEMKGWEPNDNLKSILSNLHTMKGLSGTIGVIEVERLSKKIESDLKNSHFEEYEELFAQLNEAYDFFKVNYKELLGIG